MRLICIFAIFVVAPAISFSVFSQDTAATDELRARLIAEIATLVKGGEKPKAWLTVLGEKGEFNIDGADDKSLTVLLQGNPFPILWSKLSAGDIVGVSKSVAKDNGERLLLAAELALAHGFNEQASDLIVKVMQADPALNDKAKALAGKLPQSTPAPAAQPVSVASTTAPPTNSGSSAVAIPKRSGSARNARPRVLFDDPRLAFVRAKVKTPDGERFLGWLKRMPSDQENFAYALAYVVSGDDAFATRAIDYTQKHVDQGPLDKLGQFDELADAAEVYDWCYDKIPADKRKAWAAWMLKSFDKLKDQYMLGYHNYAAKAAWSFALAGYALQGDDPRAAELLENAYVKRWQKLILPACKAGMAGGAWAEGEGYGSTTCHALIELAEAARCAEGKDLYSEAPEFFAGRLAFEMFLDEPGVNDGGHRLWINGDMSRIRNWDDALQQRLELQDALRGTELAAFAQAYAELPAAPKCQYHSADWMDVMWRDRSAPQKPLAAFKLSHLAVGRGTVLMRSDWSDDATHVGFVAGPLISDSHGHADAGHFSIWKGGELATQAGDYRSTNDAWAISAYKRTVAHNTLLIYDPNEKFTVRNTAGALNDGGQLWHDDEGLLTGAKIIAYDARRNFTYVCADLTPAYSKKVSAVRRQLVFLRPGTIVIFDRVIAAQPAFQKVWQCYLAGQATASGKTFSTSNGKGKLSAEVLLPSDAAVTLAGNQDKAITVFGNNVAQPAGKSESGPAWRAEVRPGAARNDDTFLVVLHAYEGAAPGAATFKDSGTQVTITVPGGEDVILNTDGNPGGSIGGKGLAQTVLQREE